MIDKTNGQRMQYNPGNILPGGLVMDYCLVWMSTLSLLIISLAVLFWPFTDGNLYGCIVYVYGIQLIINYEAFTVVRWEYRN